MWSHDLSLQAAAAPSCHCDNHVTNGWREKRQRCSDRVEPRSTLSLKMGKRESLQTKYIQSTLVCLQSVDIRSKYQQVSLTRVQQLLNILSFFLADPLRHYIDLNIKMTQINPRVFFAIDRKLPNNSRVSVNRRVFKRRVQVDILINNRRFRINAESDLFLQVFLLRLFPISCCILSVRITRMIAMTPVQQKSTTRNSNSLS